MLHFIKLCWRDLWRNRRRTILTGLVMMFSVMLLVFSIAMGDGAHDKMIRAATDSFVGHGQVQHPDFRHDPVLDNRIEGANLRRALALVNQTRGVEASAPRLSAGGLISRKVSGQIADDNVEAWRAMVSEGAALLGVSPAAEARVSTIPSSIVPDNPAQRCLRGCAAVKAEFSGTEGDCRVLCIGADKGFDMTACRTVSIKACPERCPEGAATCDTEACRKRFLDYCEPARFLAATDPYQDHPWSCEVVLGSGLAKVLSSEVGDLVAITTGTAKGRTWGSICRIAGIAKTQSQEINRTFALTHIDKLAEGLEVPDSATQIVFAVSDLDRVDRISNDVRAGLSGIPEVTALSWKELAPELDIFMKIDQGSMIVMLVLMIMVVAVLLANVVIMSGMERTREYGIRLAMGESPARITTGLIVETMLLTALATIVGLAAGEALVILFMHVPMDWGMGEMESAGVVIDTVFHTKFSVMGMLFSAAVVWFFALAGALIPAFRIRRLKPVQAIRFV